MNDWKDDIINSLEGLSPAKAPENSFYKLQQRLSEKKQQSPPRTWIGIAAAISLILIGNMYILKKSYSSDELIQSSNTVVITTNYNIYQK